MGEKIPVVQHAPPPQQGYLNDTEYNGLNANVPQNSYTEILTPKMMVLGGGAFGR